MSAVAVLCDATVAHGDATVWSGVDVKLVAGEFVGILGPNGAGKSTFLEVLLGLQSLRKGHALVLGAPPGERRERIGYLPQRRSLRERVRTRARPRRARPRRRPLGHAAARRLRPAASRGSRANRGRDRRGRRRRLRAQADRGVLRRGTAASADRAGAGAQARTAAGRRAARQPRPAQSASVSALVQRLCRAEGITVALVAHDVNPLLPYLDRVVYFARGRAVTGTPAEVITTETLSALYGAGVEVLKRSDGRLVVVGQPDMPAHHSHDH